MKVGLGLVCLIIAMGVPARAQTALACGQPVHASIDAAWSGTSTHSERPPARAGGIISIFATGLGLTDITVGSGEAPPAGLLANVTVSVTVTVGGQPAAVSFAGLAPGFAGVYQINAQVPAGIAPGPAVPVVLTQGGVASNTATIGVR